MSTANSSPAEAGLKSGERLSAPASDAGARWLNPARPIVWAVLMSVLVGFGAIRYRLRAMPLERDEGEYAYSGQLLLQGISPYKLAYNMKLPGIYAAYAGVMWAFGQTATGIHVGLILVNAVTLLLLYGLVDCMFGRLAALVAACSWAVLSAGTSVLGFQAHATNFVIAPALLGILLLVRARGVRSWQRLFWSGFFCGIAVLMKQHGVFFVLFCLLEILDLEIPDDVRHDGVSWRRLLRQAASYLSGAAAPYLVTCGLLWRAGVFRRFWFWTVLYAGEYSKIGLRRAMSAFWQAASGIGGQGFPIWILAALGFSTLWWSVLERRQRHFLALLLLCSFLSLCPGGFFRPHYFILILPVSAILVGVSVSAMTRILTEQSRPRAIVAAPVLVFLVCLGIAIFHQRATYFRILPLEVFESSYPHSPFVAAERVADYIQSNSEPNAHIAVIGSEPEVYFEAQRHSATGYLYMYSLITRQKYTKQMQDEFLRELIANQPEYLIYFDVWDSWGERTGAPHAVKFMDELQKFMRDGYQQVRVVDLKTTTDIRGNAAEGYQAQPGDAIFVLRKKPLNPR